MVRRYSQVLQRVWVYGILLAGSAALSAAPMLQAVLRPPDLAPGDGFGGGVVVSADGSTILAAAVLADCSAGSNCGAVYVFSRRFGAWRQEARLTAADAAGGDIFGDEMALSAAGDVALIGTSFKDCAKGPDCGAAYVFARTAEGTWKEQQKLVSAGLDQLDEFGSGVALSRDGATALIGAFGENCSEFANCGAVYEFVRNGDSWSQAGRIPPPQELSGIGFGGSVALSGDGQTLLVEENQFGVVAGRVHAFRRSGDGWVHEASIDAPDEVCDVLFGEGVTLSDDGNTALIPAQTKIICGGFPPPSHVFVYTRQGGTWSQQTQLIPAQGSLSGGVALSGDGSEAVLGLQESFCNSLDGRVAVLFTRSGQTWSEAGDLRALNPRPADFSASVGLSSAGDVAAVGGYAECLQSSSGFVSNPDGASLLVFGGDPLAEVPALSGLGLVALALALAAAGAALLRRELRVPK